MDVLKLMMVMLMATYASAAELSTLVDIFNKTVVGNCKAENAVPTTITNQPTESTVTTVSAASTGSTASTASTASTESTASTASTASTESTTATTPTTSETTPATTTADAPTERSIQKRSTDTPLCVAQENKVLAAKNKEEFNALLQEYTTCQKETCPSLANLIGVLNRESDAATLRVCGLLLVFMFVISYFG